jgi:gliding motility-associated-like protein
MAAYAQTPVASFSSNVTSGCSPLTVQFNDLSTNNPTSWAWDFGNGQTSSLQNPQATYNSPGSYTVTLIVKNAAGANAIRQTNYITVNTSPTANFGENLNLACIPSTINFIDKSLPGQGSITSWTWNFGDSSGGSNQQNPSHLYTQTGYFSVSLTVTNSGGCSNSITETRVLRFVQGIQPNFTWNQTSTSCSAPYTLNFLNQTAGPGTLTYNWSLGTGASPATSTATNPAGVAYPAAGNDSVTLSVQSSLGCSQTLTQAVPLSTSTPLITGPTTGCLNTPISFSNGSTPTPLSSLWKFGDGTSSNQSAPSKTYTAAGTYTVTLINNFASCTDSTTSTIAIGTNFVPVFNATPSIACQAPLAVQFKDLTSPADSLWLWNFGDATPPSTAQNPPHTYTAPGSYTVTLTATNANGCSGTATTVQAVNITAPTISMTPASGCINAPIAPVAVVTAIDGVAGYSWAAPGSTNPTSTIANPTFTYTAPGLYSLTLTITTNGGCTATQTFTDFVEIGTPTTIPPGSITINPSPVCGNGTVTFTAATITPVDAYLWNFGDAALIDTGQIVTHIYKNFGLRVITLTVDNGGCQTSQTTTLTVSPAIPNFGYKVNCPAFNNSVTFLDSSKVDANPLTYVWNFGDGTANVTVSTPPYSPPTHVYAPVPPVGAQYSVTLTITDGICTTSTTKPVTLANIIPSFNISANPVCENQAFSLTQNSQSFPAGTPVVAAYTWIINGISQPGGDTLVTSIPKVGPSTLGLMETDINGCVYTDATPQTITVTGPTAKFTAPADGCLNSPVTFTDNSTPYPGPPANPIVKWDWIFGDGKDTVTNAPPFTHTYADTGTFTNLALGVTDNIGCSSLFIDPNPIRITGPQALFATPDSFYCPNAPLTFIDSSQGYGLTYQWTFSNGNTSTAVNPVQSFPNNGQQYSVTLTVTDQYGCPNSLIKPVLIQSPIAAFTISDTTTICVPLQTMFTAQGQYYDSLYWNFGDGSTSTLPTTSHFYNTFNAADTFYASLILQGPGGCLDSATRRVLVLNPNTTTTFTFSPNQNCDSVVAAFNLLPPGYTSYILSFGDGQSFSSSDPNDTTFTHTYYTPDSYQPQLALTDATGCIVNINGNPGGNNDVTVLGAVIFFNVNQQAFCDSGTVIFNDFTVSNDGVLSKAYNFGDGTTITQAPPFAVPFDTTHFYNTPGSWPATLSVVTDHGCPASYTDTIRDYQTPHPTIGTSGNLCSGLVQFLGSLVTPDPDSVSWSWNFGNGQTINVQNPLVTVQPGSYPTSLRAYIPFGCADTVSTTITINPEPVIKGPAEISTPVGVPVTIPFTYSSNVTTYNWTPTANLDCATCPNPAATLTFNQEYTVVVTDSNSCTDTASILIKTICNEGNYFLPNTFSPNGDGVNDYFYPRGTSLYNIQSMRVFNRWGQLVFQRQNFAANSETMGWDGTFNGHPAPSDAYVYIVEVICNNAQVVALHGNVTLIR